MRAAALSLPIVAVVAASASCWSLTTDTEDLSSGVAASDGGSADVNASLDGGGSGEVADVVAPPFCLAHGAGAVDCVDFDGKGTTIADYGFSPHATGGGSVSLDAISFSPPRSFVAEMPASHGDCAYAAIEHDYPEALRYRVSFAFRVDPLGGDPDSYGFAAVLGANLGGGQTEQTFFSTGTPSREPYAQYQTVDGSGSQNDTLPFPTKGKAIAEWLHAALEIDYRSPPTAKVTIDGEEISFPMTRFPAGAADQPHQTFVHLGWHCHAASFKPARLHIDDVLVESLP